jgi:hypothetical protein
MAKVIKVTGSVVQKVCLNRNTFEVMLSTTVTPEVGEDPLVVGRDLVRSMQREVRAAFRVQPEIAKDEAPGATSFTSATVEVTEEDVAGLFG